MHSQHGNDAALNNGTIAEELEKDCCGNYEKIYGIDTDTNGYAVIQVLHIDFHSNGY